MAGAWVVCLTLSVAGCVNGPLVNHETARTVGRGQDELIGGYGNAGYAFKWNHGLSENFDLGVQLEQLSVGVKAKYAFLHRTQGLSLAGAIGVGVSGNGSHYYGDLMLSDLVQKVEPFVTLRLVHVNVDEAQFRDNNNQSVISRIDAPHFDYGQILFGSRYWFTPNWLISAELSALFGLGNVHFGDTLLGAVALGYHF